MGHKSLTLKYFLKTKILPVIPFTLLILLYAGFLNWLPHPIYSAMGLDITNTDSSGYINLVLPIDHQIPFIPGFVVVYLLSIVWWGIAPFFVYNILGKKVFVEYCIVSVITSTVAFILFLTVPTINTLRPTNVNYNGFIGWLMHLTYSSSIGLHLFPSGHTMYTWLFVFICIRKQTNIKFLIINTILAVLVTLSSLFIKQHELVDAICGLGIIFVGGSIIRLIKLSNVIEPLHLKLNHLLRIN